MNDYQVAVEKMIDGTIAFYHENLDKLKAGESILSTHFGQLEEQDTELKKFKKIQQADITGISVEKKNAKSELSEDIYQATGALRSYARDNNNDLLYEEIDESKSGINKKSDENVVSYCRFSIDKLNEYIEELKPYGTTAEELVNLTKQCTAFAELLLKPARMRKEVKAATDSIKIIISKSLLILSDSIDNDMLRYQDSEPELYKEYTIIREIDDSKTMHLALHGHVGDADSDCDGTEDCSLEYVKVTVKFKAGTALADNDRTTSKKGNYQFDKLPEGMCTVTFEKNYYDTLVVDSEIHKNKATKLDVKMKKTNG